MYEADSSVDDDAQESPLKSFRLVVSLQPSNAVGVIGGNASFTCAFLTNVPAAFTTYQWQIRTDGVTWANLAQTPGYYTGVTTTTLNVLAIDNFLATRTSLDFRCVATNYSGSLQTNSAALSVPIHTSWQPQALAFGVGLAASGVAANLATPLGSTPTVTGFAGPYTYAWIVDPPFHVVNAAAANPVFTAPDSGSVGMFNSTCRCTITSGANSITTDDYYLFGYFAAAPIAAGVEATPVVSTGPFSVVTNFASPWSNFPPGCKWIRMIPLVSPYINIQTPTIAATTFVLSGTPLAGGTAVRMWPWYPATVNSVGIGCSIFYG